MTEAGNESLQRVFRDVFSAQDIAEPLISFDSGVRSEDVLSQMEQADFDVVGVRTNGRISGFVDRSNLETGLCGDYAQPLDEARVIDSTAPLAQVVSELDAAPWIFVTAFGAVAGIVTRSDLEKSAVRMWLFGMVTLIEMRFNRMIERFCPDDQWREFVSESRIAKAEALQAERQRRNQQVQLLDCLQFSDKGQILARNAELRAKTQFESRRQVEEAFKSLEKLRNNLAHSQQIVTGDWPTIVRLAENLDRVIRGPVALMDEASG